MLDEHPDKLDDDLDHTQRILILLEKKVRDGKEHIVGQFFVQDCDIVAHLSSPETEQGFEKTASLLCVGSPALRTQDSAAEWNTDGFQLWRVSACALNKSKCQIRTVAGKIDAVSLTCWKNSVRLAEGPAVSMVQRAGVHHKTGPAQQSCNLQVVRAGGWCRALWGCAKTRLSNG